MKPLLIDYGHGGLINDEYQTPGGKQYTHTDVDPPLTLYEGVSNRMSAAALMRLALNEGAPVFDVVADRWVTVAPQWHDLEQRDVPLSARVRSANAHGRLSVLLSLHSNAIGNSIIGPSLAANGVDIYTSRGQTGADAVATDIFNAFKSLNGLRLRGGEYTDGDPDHEADFYIVRKTVMPAVLGEVGFFTNLDDARYLANPHNHAAIASCYWYGVSKHLIGGNA